MTADPRLATKLEELAETPAPPMNIDVEHARQLGQRRLYTRRATLAAGVAAFAGAALATPSLLKAVTAPAPGLPTIPPPDPNPLITHADFGWLPDSITRVAYTNGRPGDYVQAVNEDEVLGTGLVLSVQPTTDVSAYFRDPKRQPVTVPAPPVNGRTAHWVTLNASDPLNGGDSHLLWEIPNGRWALLRASHQNDFPDPQDVLLRIAARVTVAERHLPLPVRITGLPPVFRIDAADFYRPMPRDEGTGAWALKVYYHVNKPAFSIEVHPEGSSRIAKAIPGMVRKTAKGIDVYVGLSNYEPGPINAIGGAQGILDRITPLGMDEREWTTRPIS